MAFQLIPITVQLDVEGNSEARDVSKFKGRAIAIGLQDTDPIAASSPEAGADTSLEGLSGLGTTYFLVCDPSKPTPVWIAKQDIEKHRIG